MAYNLNRAGSASATPLIVSGSGINVEKINTQYVISVNTEFIPKYIDAVKSSISSLETTLDALNKKIKPLALVSDLDKLSTKVSGITADVNGIAGDVLSLVTEIGSVSTEIADIKGKISNLPKMEAEMEILKATDKDMDRIQVDKFIGSIINPLSKTLKQVLNVTYCGISLNPLSYSISNNILYLHVNRFGIEVDVNDTIYITYTYTQI